MPFVKTNLPCPKEGCSSSDAYNVDEDGKGYCFSCESVNTDGATGVIKEKLPPKVTENLKEGDYYAIKSRGISKETCKKLDISVGVVNGTITSHIYGYYDPEGKRVVTKERICPKEAFPQEDARSVYQTDKGVWLREGKVGIFGHQAFNKGGKCITITEGELDAAAVYEMNGGFPAVSVRNGASGAHKDCAAFFEYLDSFDKVVLCFDMDEQGKKAAGKVAELFPGKAFIMNMTQGKDANEYLMQGKGKAWEKEFWQAKAVKVDGICFGMDDWNKLSTARPQRGVPLIWDGLNKATYGARLGEVWTLGGGTGLGKSEAYKEVAYGLVHDQGLKVGMIFLEEGHDRTGQCLIGKALGHRYFLEGSQIPDKDEMDAAVKLMAENVAITHGIESTWEKVEAAIKVMKRTLGIDYIFLDHVTAIAEGKGGDVNAALHMIYEKMNHIAVQEDLVIFAISHLNQAGNKNYTEGAHVSLRDFYGSGAIMQRSNFVIGFEGDIRGEKILKDHRRLVILKDRNRGDAAGCVVDLKFHKHMNDDELDGRLLEVIEGEGIDKLEDEGED